MGVKSTVTHLAYKLARFVRDTGGGSLMVLRAFGAKPASRSTDIAAQNDCFTCKALVHTEFEALPERVVAIINVVKVTRNYRAGEPIFRAGETSDGVHCVGAGLVCSRKKDKTGTSIPFRLRYPGDTLGFRSFLSGTDHESTAEALEPTQACFIGGDTLRDLLSRNLDLCLSFLRRLASDLDAAEERLLQRKTLNARARLAQLLLVLFGSHGTMTENGGLLLKLPFTRQDMAAAIGVNVKSMSRIIRSFQDESIARFSGRTVQVPDFEKLVAELGPHAGVNRPS
jgi:CRP/FNR family transcriptional regulator